MVLHLIFSIRMLSPYFFLVNSGNVQWHVASRNGFFTSFAQTSKQDDYYDENVIYFFVCLVAPRHPLRGGGGVVAAGT
jgi:hypothetical protein